MREMREIEMWIILSVIAAIISAFAVILQKSGSERPDVIHVGALCTAAEFEPLF